MGTEEVCKNIYRIPVRLTGNPLKELNSYLIKDPGRSLLIDTGFRREECREDLLAGLEELGVYLEDIDIFLTHLHSDHSGLAAELIAPGGKVYIGKIDYEWLDNTEFIEAKRNHYLRSYRQGGTPAKTIDKMLVHNPAVTEAAVPGCENYVPMHSGEKLKVGGYELECIWTPGHTPGHMCLWNEENGIMFTGDHILFDITPNITQWPGVEDSLGDYLDSLEMMKWYPVRLALPGHRKTGDYSRRISQLQEHHQRRLDEALRVIKETPGMSTYEITGHLTWRIRARNWEEFPDTQKFFAVGECMAHLDYLQKRGQISSGMDKEGILRYFYCG